MVITAAVASEMFQRITKLRRIIIGGGFEFLNKGLARTQIPTNKNCAPELPTFGVIAGVSFFRSAMEQPRPGGTALVITVNPYAR